MRHKNRRLRLNQKPDHARQLQRNIVTSLLLYESIRTTRKRARIVQPLVDQLITIAKNKTPSVAIRAINMMVTDRNASRKLMEVFSKRYTTRSSGFTRLKAIGSRKGDGAEIVDLTLVDAEIVTTSKSAPAHAEKKPKNSKKPKKQSSESPAARSSQRSEGGSDSSPK